MAEEWNSKLGTKISKPIRWLWIVFSKLKGASQPLSKSKADAHPQLSGEPLASPYFSNFDPSPTKLRMFFGRRREIKEIANNLGVGVRTVETHRERIMRKLNIHSIAGLTKFAIGRGWVSVGSKMAA